MNNLRIYWERLLEEHGENWLIYDKYWYDVWDNNKNVNLIADNDNKGFVLLYNFVHLNTQHIVFAFVAKKFRKQGVLRNIMNNIFSKYNKLSLSSLDEHTDKIWERFGFKCIEKRMNNFECSEYEYSRFLLQ
jgi:predicted acetyltransferase